MKRLQMIIFISLLTIMSSICYAKSNTVEIPDDIRIGLFSSSTAKSSFTLSSPGGIEIGTMNDGKYTYEDETLPNEKITVTKSSQTGAIYIEGYGDIGDKNNYPYFKALEKDGLSIIEIDGKKYRGNVEVRRFSSSDMTVINHVSMQEYLYGVVPREIGGNSPIEAVKAQAIVARTYAARNYNKRSELGFNLLPTADDQAYGGYEWEVANSNKAVDLTDGMVVTYDGELISGLYFSTSGGYTEDAANVWGGNYDYLKAVPDTYEPEIEGNTTWEVTMTSNEVKNSLAKNGVNVGDVLDLVPMAYTDAGRILELKVVGTDGEKTITKSNVRTYLGLKSQWYSINDDAPVVGESAKKIVKEDEPSEDTPTEDETESNNKTLNLFNEDAEQTGDEWYLKYELPETAVEDVDYKVGESHFVKEFDDGYDDEDESSDEKETDSEPIELTQEEKEGEHIIIESEVKPLLKGILSIIKNGIPFMTVPKTLYEDTKLLAKKEVSTFTFRGRGWGHAVGMSQNGAKGMAKEGFTAEEIITWYYSGVTIQG